MELLLVFVDVTDILASESKMTQFRVKDMILRSISHEIRTPTTSIINLPMHVKERNKKKLSVEDRQYLDIITNSGKLLQNIVDDIIEYTNILTHDFVVQPALVSVIDIMQRCSRLIRMQAIIKGVDVEI